MEKIKQYLISRDIEMAMLGCNLLEKQVPEDLWEFMLKNFLNPAFRWTLDIHGITIEERFTFEGFADLWAMKKTEMPLYTMSTGQAGMIMIQDAIRQSETDGGVSGHRDGATWVYSLKEHSTEEGERIPGWMPAVPQDTESSQQIDSNRITQGGIPSTNI